MKIIKDANVRILIYVSLSILSPSSTTKSKSLSTPSPACGQPGAPSNRWLEGQAPHRGKYSAGEEIVFSCNPGYVLAGGRKRVCGEDGRWTGNVPFCSEIPVLGVWVILSDFSGENIAFGGIASQSHVLWSYGPQLATDGNTQTCSFTTRKDGQRWWQVRVGSSSSVLPYFTVQ